MQCCTSSRRLHSHAFAQPCSRCGALSQLGNQVSTYPVVILLPRPSCSLCKIVSHLDSFGVSLQFVLFADATSQFWSQASVFSELSPHGTCQLLSSVSLCVPCLVTSGLRSRTGSSRQFASRLDGFVVKGMFFANTVCMPVLSCPVWSWCAGRFDSCRRLALWRCLRQAAGVTCSRFSKDPPWLPHAICDSGLSGQFRHDFNHTPASKEHSMSDQPISFPSGPSLSLVLLFFPFAWYVWAHSLTVPLVPHIKLRLRP